MSSSGRRSTAKFGVQICPTVPRYQRPWRTADSDSSRLVSYSESFRPKWVAGFLVSTSLPNYMSRPCLLFFKDIFYIYWYKILPVNNRVKRCDTSDSSFGVGGDFWTVRHQFYVIHACRKFEDLLKLPLLAEWKLLCKKTLVRTGPSFPCTCIVWPMPSKIPVEVKSC